MNTKLVSSFLALVLTLAASAPFAARADEVGYDSPDRSSDAHNADLYKGSDDEQKYVDLLKTLSRGALRAHALGLRGEIGLACGFGGVVVGLSGVVETIPFIGMFPKFLTTKTIVPDYDPTGESDLLYWGTVFGGGIDAVLSTLDIPWQYLVDGKIGKLYSMTTINYRGTAGVKDDLLKRHSACRMSIDKLRDIKDEVAHRAAGQPNSTTVAEGPAPKTVAPAHCVVENCSPAADDTSFYTPQLGQHIIQ